MSSLRLYLLGPPYLERDGVPLKVDTRKNVALIAYLAVTGSPGGHTRETLITLLWPELEPSRARAGLRRNLSVLKKTLSGEWLVVDRETIGTDPKADFWSDVDQFQSLLMEQRGHGHPEADVCPECLTGLAEAVELYRGDFLEGFSLRDSPNFDDWQFFQTESLRQELASALERLTRGHTAQGQYQVAIPYARRWLALDPLHEPVCRHLMALYAWSGQRAAALRQYAECERVLDEELGVPPERETAQLFQAIKEQREIPGELPLDLPPPGDSLTPPLSAQPASHKHNLPVQPTPFVGRETELAELGKLLADPDVRLVTVLGAGGMGKTRLTLEAATAQLEAFTHGVFFVSLAPLQSADSIVPTVAKALDFSFYERSRPDQQLLDYMSRKDMLLIMDNFEHLLDGVGWVTEVLQETTHVKIVTTSRARLNVQGEHLFPVLGMDFPDTIDGLSREDGIDKPAEVDQYSAIQLFLQAARRAQPGFDLTPENRKCVVRICHLVEGMPLAILLAAAWLEMLSPAEITAEIGKGLDFLESDSHDLPARQRSVRAVFDHSWHLLPGRERKVFQALSVFRGGFTRQAAKQVVGGSLRDLRSLVNKSLVYRTPAGRYEMHEMLRQYAADILTRSPAYCEGTRDRHAAYYTVTLGQQTSNLKGPQAQSALAEIELESENARAAWTWAAEHERVDLLKQPMEALFLFYLWRRRYQEGEAACRLAVEHLESVVANDGLRVLARLLTWQGNFSWRLGRIEFANCQLQRSLALLERLQAEDLDIRPEKASVLLQMGHITFDVDLERAERLSEQSLSLFRELEDSWGTANALSALGWAAMGGGGYPEARQLFEESLAVRQSLGDQRGIIDSLGGLCFTAFFHGQFEEAEAYMRESIAFLQNIGVQADIFDDVLVAESTCDALDESATVHAPYQESLGFYSDIGFSHSYVATNSSLGYVKKHLGQYEEARLQARLGLMLGKKAGWRSEVALSLHLLGDLALVEEDYTEAHRCLSESIEILRETQILELSDSLATLGFAARGLGQISRAEQYLAEALGTASEVQTSFPLTTALPATALLLASQGEKERAVELYALASRYPRVANSRWFEDVAGRHISDVAATLPPDVVAAAQERGKTRNLEATVTELLAELGG